MAYKIEIGERTVYLAQKAESVNGDYIVYEWNDGIFIDSDDDYDDDYDDDEDEDEESDRENYEDDIEIELGEEEDEIEEAVRLDIETLLSAGFVPQGGVSSFMTPEYTTCYSQAFFRAKK